MVFLAQCIIHVSCSCRLTSSLNNDSSNKNNSYNNNIPKCWENVKKYNKNNKNVNILENNENENGTLQRQRVQETNETGKQ